MDAAGSGASCTEGVKTFGSLVETSPFVGFRSEMKVLRCSEDDGYVLCGQFVLFSWVSL